VDKARKTLRHKIKKLRPLIVVFVIAAFVIAGTTLVSLLMRGYRPDFKSKTLFPTGLLAASSLPRGALVYINDKLVTATDDTVNLPPGDYQIKLVKDGYFPWQKKVKIKKEVVFQTDAYLFRTAPDLKPLTTNGALNPALSPDGLKVVYAVASASAETKNGLWVSELREGGFNPIRGTTKQLVQPHPGIDWTKATLIWNPEGTEILALFGSLEEPASAYLLPADRLTAAGELRNVVFQLPLIIARWQQEKRAQLNRQLKQLPEEWQKIASESARLITFSPKEEKFFYLAVKETQIPENLLPHPPARSTQPEERKIQPGRIYVYDIKEDTNFFIIEGEKIGIRDPVDLPPLEAYYYLSRIPLYWLATEKHLVFIEENQVKVVETDGTNKQTLFSGPLQNSYAFPSPEGNRLIVLTSMHPHLPANLYEVTIR